MNNQKTITIIISIVVVVLAISISQFIFQPEINNYFNRIEFDSEQWKNWEESETDLSLRWNMVHNLRKEHELVGMTINEINELLGKPDRENKNFISYHLGMSGHGIDTGTLYLEMKNGIIIEVKLWHG